MRKTMFRFFVLMFGGGKAELKRVKPKIKKLDDEGLEIEVKKRMKPKKASRLMYHYRTSG